MWYDAQWRIFYFATRRGKIQKLVKRVIYRFETYIGNIVYWKLKNRLETKFLNWKQDYQIGKQKKYIEKNELRLETKFVNCKQGIEIGNKLDKKHIKYLLFIKT